jgi:hypothetical protein
MSGGSFDRNGANAKRKRADVPEESALSMKVSGYRINLVGW